MAFTKNEACQKARKRQEKGQSKHDPDSAMTQMLEMSEKAFKITMISMLRFLIEKVGNTTEHMSKVNKEMKTLRENQKEMLHDLTYM